MVGPLPTEIGLLKNLEALALNTNMFTGTIPLELSHLTQLSLLLLYDIVLSGAIPTQIGLLTSMTNLNLRNNAISGSIPTELGQLKDLEYLVLDGNNLSGTIPTEVCLLPLLTGLQIDCAKVICPAECGTCNCAPGVDVLTFPSYTIVALEDPASPQSRAKVWLGAHPELDTLPDWRLQQQYALVTFYYSMEGDQWEDASEQRNFLNYSVNECQWGTQYSNLPRCNELGGIQAIHLDYLTNDVPEFINIAKVPPELAMIPNLAFIELEGNDFSRDITYYIPSELSELTGLQRIKLDSNRIVGTLPAYLGDFTSMEQLDLPSNASAFEARIFLELLHTNSLLTSYLSFFLSFNSRILFSN